MKMVRHIAILVGIALVPWSEAAGQGVTFPPGTQSGVIDVTQAPYFADNSGQTDATAALQAALNAYPNGSRIIYLPDGLYTVSDRLDWPNGPGGQEYKRTTLQGQSRDGTIIRLTANNPLYQDASTRRGVIWTGPSPAQRFGNEVRDLTVDVHVGNPGAAGIQFNASNWGTVNNVRILSQDGQGAIGLDCAYTWEIGPAYITRLEVFGFDVGIRCNADMNSLTFEHIHLEGQNQLGIWNRAQQLNIRGLTSVNSVTAIYNEESSSASICIVDSEFEGAGNAATMPAILNRKNMWVRNCTFSGYALSIENDDLGRECMDVYDGYVAEHHPHCNLRKLFAGGGETSLDLPIAEVPVVPWGEPSTWVSITAFGAVGDDGNDDGPALQAAIDSGAETVYLPGGMVFTFNSDVLVRGAVQRIIGLRGRIEGNATFRFVDDGPDDAPVTEIAWLNGSYGSDLVVSHESTRTLLFRDAAGIQPVGNGPGDLHLVNIASAAIVFNDQAQHIWARQLNIEEETTKIRNNGATFWVLGYKTERPGTILETTAGGHSEVLGAFVYSTGGPKVDPMFVVEDAQLSVNGIKETNFNGNRYTWWVEETRYGETRALHRDSLGYGNFYYLGDQPLTTALEDQVIAPSLLLAPNPTSGSTTLFGEFLGPFRTEVHDTLGRLAWQRGPSVDRLLELDALPAGVYCVQLVGAGWQEVLRIVRE